MLDQKIHGQPELVTHLQRTLEGKNHNPLLLVGPEGVGKRTATLEAAKLMVGEESQAYQVGKGIHPDVIVVTPDGDELKVDPVRQALQQTAFRPSRAPQKWVLIEGVDTANPASANALLKSLEEQSPYVRYFLTAGNLDNVMPTIVSRCVLVRCWGLPEDFLVESLGTVENLTVARTCARLAGGSVSRVRNLFYSGGLETRDKILNLLSALAAKNISGVMKAVDDIDFPWGLKLLESILRDLVLVHHVPDKVFNLDKASELSSLAYKFNPEAWAQLRNGLREIQFEHSRSDINLPFHVKALLLSQV